MDTPQKEGGQNAAGSPAAPAWIKGAAAKLENDLAKQYGESQRARLQRGLKQVSEFWRASDGDQSAFEDFVRKNFAGDQASLDTMFGRFNSLLEQSLGHMTEIGRELRQQTDLDLGPVQSYDEIFAGYDPSAHLIEDLFNNKLAFVVLLNFPSTTLDERLAEGEKWTRRQWAETRLAEYFSKRIPADVNLAISKAGAESGQYISEYNVWMHHLLDDQGRRLFPAKLRLLSHWNLRDEIKSNYKDPQDGLAKQRMIEKVMERIVTQTIPESVVNNPQVDWNPFSNEVKPAAVKDWIMRRPVRQRQIRRSPIPATCDCWKYSVPPRLADPYSPNAPTLIARRFNEDRQLPEARVQRMFEQVLGSPLVPRIAALIQKRLGRPLEPFDIWYNGFRPKTKYSAAELDAIVAKKYPNAKAYEKDMPALLEKLGFSSERAKFLADNIVVDPARGSGTQWAPACARRKPTCGLGSRRPG